MTEPIESRYDYEPYVPPEEEKPKGGEEDGREEDPPDLGNTDSPDLTVWEKRPSFNDPPIPITNLSPGGKPASADDDPPPAADFQISLGSVAFSIEAMLTRSRALVAQYEALRTRVLSSKGTVFGQEAMLPDDDPGGFTPGTDVFYDMDEPDGHSEPSQWREPALQFAALMNPRQEKTLQQIGATLQLVGEYIAVVNHSGQVYAEADRKSRFPNPPGEGAL
jgi:hypothetical protein